MRKGVLCSAVLLALLAGTASAAQASMSWSPASHQFPATETGVSSAPVTFTLTAVCDADGGANMCALSSHPYGFVDAPGVDFNVDSNNCSAGALTTPSFMGAGSTASCTVRVALKPSSTGPIAGVLQTSDPAAPDVILNGVGVDSDLEALLKKCKKKKYRKKHRKKCRKARQRAGGG